jgi:hypothetical protein
MLVTSMATKKVKVSRDAGIPTHAAMLADAAFWGWEVEGPTRYAGVGWPFGVRSGLWYAPDVVLHEEMTVVYGLAGK